MGNGNGTGLGLNDLDLNSVQFHGIPYFFVRETLTPHAF
jgi:hypothetical protein